MVFFNGFWIFFPGNFSVSNLFTSYFAPAFFVCLFVFWKVFKKTKFRTPLTADITSGKQRVDDEEEVEEREYAAKQAEYANGTWYVKAWRWVYNLCFS